jgi:transcriptional regulator with XRE-family HTH domain
MQLFLQGLAVIRTTTNYPLGMAAGRPAKQPRTPFGQRVTKAREVAGLTQVQLAERVGVTQPVVAYWEREPVALRAEQLAALADALGVSGDYLLGRSGKEPSLKGPTGKARQVFERVSKLSRSRQQYIIKVVEDLVGSVNGK